jgi:hypothetical protein
MPRRRRRKYVWKLEDWEVADAKFGLGESLARAEMVHGEAQQKWLEDFVLPKNRENENE